MAEDWADRIKVLRLSLGLSQAEFGAILGVTFQTVNRWENVISNHPNVIKRSSLS